MAGWYEFAISGAVQTVEFAAANMTSTSHFELPAGTTAQRPGTPVEGDTRYNTSDKAFEVYSGSAKGWVQMGSSLVSGLNDLADVTLSSEADGDFLKRSGGVYVNTPFNAAVQALPWQSMVAPTSAVNFNAQQLQTAVFETVASLPVTNLVDGRVVFLNADSHFYIRRS